MAAYEWFKQHYGCPRCHKPTTPEVHGDDLFCPNCGYVYPEHGLSGVPSSGWQRPEDRLDTP